MNVTVPPLPYSMHELEPRISRRTLAAHYGRHHVNCIERARALVDATALESASLEVIVRTSDELDQPSLFNVAAEAWNHSFYWSSLHPAGGGDASGPIAEMIGVITCRYQPAVAVKPRSFGQEPSEAELARRERLAAEGS